MTSFGFSDAVVIIQRLSIASQDNVKILLVTWDVMAVYMIDIFAPIISILRKDCEQMFFQIQRFAEYLKIRLTDWVIDRETDGDVQLVFLSTSSRFHYMLDRICFASTSNSRIDYIESLATKMISNIKVRLLPFQCVRFSLAT